MSEVWNKVYKPDSSSFGGEPSNFALLCLNHMKTNNAKRVLELGVGQDNWKTVIENAAKKGEAR